MEPKLSPHPNRAAGTVRKLAVAGCGLIWNFAAAPVIAQLLPYEAPPPPTPYVLDSGELSNSSDGATPVFAEVIQMPGSASLRLHFQSATIAPGGFVRTTSVQDGEVQELDANQLEQWQNSTAYFNGDAVLLELVAGARTMANQITVSEVETDFPDAAPRGESGQCGICGTDDRVPSAHMWAARLMPDRCTASVIANNSCMISAGHCHTANMTVQFNVPASNADCTLTHPPVADQFPIINSSFAENLPFDDWAVLVTGRNNLNERPFDRYLVFRSVAGTPGVAGQTVSLSGYGIDQTCTRNRTQQTASGPINQVGPEFYWFSTDLRVGNSGSGLIRSNQIVGIATGCQETGCPNFAVRVDRPSFAAARAALCSAPGNDPCLSAIPLFTGATQSLNTTNATPDGPSEPGLCNFGGDSQFGNDLWYEHTAACTGNLTVSVCNSGFDTKLAIYAGFGCPSTSSAIACNNDACGTRSQITLAVTAGQQFLIRVGGQNGASGAGSIVATCTQTSACALAGDINEDGFIRGDDIPGYIRAKLGQPPQGGENPACADFETGTLAGDTTAFVAALID